MENPQSNNLLPQNQTSDFASFEINFQNFVLNFPRESNHPRGSSRQVIRRNGPCSEQIDCHFADGRNAR